MSLHDIVLNLNRYKDVNMKSAKCKVYNYISLFSELLRFDMNFI